MLVRATREAHACVFTSYTHTRPKEGWVVLLTPLAYPFFFSLKKSPLVYISLNHLLLYSLVDDDTPSTNQYTTTQSPYFNDRQNGNQSFSTSYVIFLVYRCVRSCF
jgi:hypothetical protein